MLEFDAVKSSNGLEFVYDDKLALVTEDWLEPVFEEGDYLEEGFVVMVSAEVLVPEEVNLADFLSVHDLKFHAMVEGFEWLHFCPVVVVAAVAAVDVDIVVAVDRLLYFAFVECGTDCNVEKSYAGSNLEDAVEHLEIFLCDTLLDIVGKLRVGELFAAQILDGALGHDFALDDGLTFATAVEDDTVDVGVVG